MSKRTGKGEPISMRRVNDAQGNRLMIACKCLDDTGNYRTFTVDSDMHESEGRRCLYCGREFQNRPAHVDPIAG